MSERAIPIPRAETAAWKGATLVTATRRVFPLVSFRLAFRGGATRDPAGKEGLSSLTVRMLERGTKTRTNMQIAAELEFLGGSVGLNAGNDTLQIASTTLSRNLDEVFAIIAELILAPTFPEDELEKLREEMISELALIREEDQQLGDSWFRRALYGTDPYGRFVEGTEASLSSITREEVIARWKEIAGAADLVVAAAGDIDQDRLRSLLDTHLGSLPAGRASALGAPVARKLDGVEVLLVDKPDRSQTQIFLGATAVGMRDPRYLPNLVANHAIGGMFTARVMQEVRVKRAWSYGAHSRFEPNRGEGMTGIWTFPANGDTIACVRLLLDLYREFKTTGINAEELAAAKGHLLNMLAFEVETPEQVVQRRVSELMLGLPADWTEQFVTGVEATTVESANAAAAAITPSAGLVLTIVCTAEPFVKPLSEMPEVRIIDVVPFDTDKPDEWTRVFERRGS